MITPDSALASLRSISRDRVSRDPFPYLCVENFFDDATLQELAAGAPSLERITGGRPYADNSKIYWRSPQILGDPGLTPACRAIFESFMSQEVFHCLIDLFAPDIEQHHPQLDVAALVSSEIGRRRTGLESAVMTDAQYIVHLPVHSRAGAERGPHLKGSRKLFKGFVCLRNDDDKSDGGDMRIYRVRSPEVPATGARNQIDASLLRVARIIPRRHNTLLLILNTPWSVTDVSPRGLSPHPSVYFNFVTELPYSLFEVPDARAQPRTGVARKAFANLRSRLGRAF
jgi:hypothetical protein